MTNRRSGGRFRIEVFPGGQIMQPLDLTEYHVKNAIAHERLKVEFKGKVDVVQLPPMAGKVHASR